MKKIVTVLSALLIIATPVASQASPNEDLKKFRAHYKKTFPKVPFQDFANGVYALDKGLRDQWESFEEFPSYEIFVDKGEDLFHSTKFGNGKSYKDCFPNYKKGVRQNYPMFTDGKLITLEGAINKCRTDNGEEKLKWKTGKLAYISSYLAYKSRGKKLNIKVPKDPKAFAAYNLGKKFFYSKRGQLNMSCADCHYTYPGRKIRANLLGPGIGQPTGFPAYRNKWAGKSAKGDGMGTLHRRYGGCNKQVRAKPFKAQSDEYKALEYFQTFMSNGLKVNGPSQRM